MNRIATTLAIAGAFAAGCAVTHVLRPAYAADMISAQVIQLEDSLGVTLFQRRPFELTKAGRELFRFAEPFFSEMAEVGPTAIWRDDPSSA